MTIAHGRSHVPLEQRMGSKRWRRTFQLFGVDGGKEHRIEDRSRRAEGHLDRVEIAKGMAEGQKVRRYKHRTS